MDPFPVRRPHSITRAELMGCRCAHQTIVVDGLPVYYFGLPPDEMTEKTRDALTAMIRSIRLESMRRYHAEPLH